MGDNLWSSGVVATASTGASWVDEVHNSTTASTSSSSDPAEKRLEEIKRKFHRGRILQIKHLPREVTEERSVTASIRSIKSGEKVVGCEGLVSGFLVVVVVVLTKFKWCSVLAGEFTLIRAKLWQLFNEAMEQMATRTTMIMGRRKLGKENLV
ncbi:hypothetical protein Fcan01_03931 [Folsomia candida]|uniref:Uncharacterized protein n=1 Tax=Folsomia candida TaxID=158441 RepID=A0A226F1Y4_FOLCA|nr:hypothetical protein Fcan01_03931 [Folsomia candida]